MCCAIHMCSVVVLIEEFTIVIATEVVVRECPDVLLEGCLAAEVSASTSLAPHRASTA